jgi:carboxylesterase type B
MFLSTVAGFGLLSTVVAAQQVLNADGPIAHTKYGPIQGVKANVPGAKEPINKFLGVPFAQSPVGPLRFSAPKDPQSWVDPVQATAFKPACIEQFNCQ